MKVCVIHHFDVFTPWPATSIIHPIELLLSAGHEVKVFSWDKGRKQELRPATLPVEREQVKVPVGGVLSFYRFSKELSKKLQNEKPDLIFAFDLEVLRGASDAASKLNVPLLFFAREDWPAMVKRDGDLKSMVRSAAFRWMEKSICRSKVEHAYSINYERGKKYIEWGIPYTTIYTTKAISELPVPSVKNERFSVALAGSMQEMQAIPVILEAIKDIDCDFYLIGGKDEKMPEIRRMVEDSGLSERVHITGRLDPKDFYNELSKCHVGLTLPYKTDMNKYYGVTVKTWDYMSMAMSIVASNFPVQRSVVEGNSVGMVVDPTSPGEIRDAILSLKDKTEEMGQRARRLFEEKYCWEKQRERMKESHWIFQGNKPE